MVIVWLQLRMKVLGEITRELVAFGFFFVFLGEYTIKWSSAINDNSYEKLLYFSKKKETAYQ